MSYDNTATDLATVSLAPASRTSFARFGLWLALAVLALGTTGVSSSQAASIAWTSTPYINTGSQKSIMGTGQFDQTGEFIYAENTGGGATTFDGISFSAGAISFGGATNVFHGSNVVSRTATFSSPATGPAETVTLGFGGVGASLVAGRDYRVELLFMDGRGGSINGRYTEVDGVNQGVFANGVTSVTWGDGLLVTGTFKADANFQTFTVEYFSSGGTSFGGQLNALTLYQQQVPEPSTFLLMAMGGVLVIRRRRRR